MTVHDVFYSDLNNCVNINPYHTNSMINDEGLTKETIRKTAERWVSLNSLKLKIATGLVRAV